jgi:transcriptional regulator with XRE-family HTH domain
LKKQKKRYYRDDDFLAKVGVRIREIRTSQGLTQTDLAFKCNDKDYSQINRVELGKVNFSVSYLSLIASALNVEPKELLSPLNPPKGDV